MQFDIDEQVHAIPLCEAADEARFVLPNALDGIALTPVYSVPFRLLARMYTQG
jgi:hypothetical protein